MEISLHEQLIDLTEIEDPRLACVLLLDTSGSMQGERIMELNAWLQTFKDALLQDELAVHSVDLAIITFDSVVNVVRDFGGTIESFDPPRLTAQNQRFMGKAILEALNKIEEREAQYKEYGVPYYRPLLLLITNGLPEDEPMEVVEEVKSKLHAAVTEKRISIGVLAVDVGDVDLAKLKDIADVKPWRLKGLNSLSPEQLFFLTVSSILCPDWDITPTFDDDVVTQTGTHDPIPVDVAHFPPPDWGMIEILGDSIKWKVVAASVRGTSHERNNLVCQDAFEWQIAEAGWLVAAIADGAGSASLADIGAKLAVHKAVNETVNKINDGIKHGSLPRSQDVWRLMIRDILQATREAIISEATLKQKEARELASTLILVALGPNVTIAAQIGDGASVQCKNGNIQTLTRPEPTEYLNETTFLVSPGAVDSAQFVIEDTAADTVAILSDGLQMLALEYPNWGPYIPFFKPMFAFVEQTDDENAAIAELESFLRSPRIRERSDDDLTLLLATRKTQKVRNG